MAMFIKLLILHSALDEINFKKVGLQLQSWTKHLETFSLFSTISVHHK